MKTNRRKFISTAVMGGVAASTIPLSGCGSETTTAGPLADIKARFARIDEILKQPVLKKELFSSPVIIDSLELLRLNNNFLCRVRSKDGAVGISVANDAQMKSLYPIFVNRLQQFFIGKDARYLEVLLDEVYVYQSNYKMQSLALWVPLATIEFAILDMLGNISGKSIGQLIGEIYNKQVAVYSANGDRDISVEETMERIQEEVEVSKAKAIKLKVGGRMSHTEYPAGRTEELIPMVRKTYGDKMVLYADSNGSYNVAEAIRIGKLLEEYRYDFYEEPVPFDWYQETKEVADALSIPIAGGEQEPSLHNFRWLVANDALDIVQPDMFYFGGMIRSMKVALMAHAFGKQCTPHISGGFGYLYMMHFISAIPNAGPYHEFKGFSTELPFVCKTSSLLTSDDGLITVPTGPGLGIEIDAGYIAKHQVVEL
ncbi:MAG: mandelate racemase/muconate lactonizing enzyme family protein [Bacteroidales bacterium]|jgi:L-alanine-DL-glutamate epimerase-like enolase superfamily enzyme|nr:mandelate racemase/muconate lactonizing enzyme family protein [Bacteroidales bacterium]